MLTSPASSRMRLSLSFSLMAKTSSRLSPDAPSVTERAMRIRSGCPTISRRGAGHPAFAPCRADRKACLPRPADRGRDRAKRNKLLPAKTPERRKHRARRESQHRHGNAKVVERDHQHVAAARPRHAGRRADAAIGVPRIAVTGRKFIFQGDRKSGDRMLQKVAPDVWRIAQGNDAEIAQRRDGPDSRTDQNSGRVDRARTQNDLSCREISPSLARQADTHAGRDGPVE